MGILRLNDLSSVPGGTMITLTSNGTTATFSADPHFPTFAAPDILKVIVEPNTANEEVIYITSWTAGNTSGPCLRNAEAVQNGLGSIAHTGVGWVHGPTA